MRIRHWLPLVLVLLGVSAGTSQADDPTQPTDRRVLLAKGLDLIRTRVQAQVGLGDALREAGRLDEAIAAYRQASSIYDTELRRIEKLIGFVMGAPARPTAPEGPADNVGIGVGTAGRGFVGRGGGTPDPTGTRKRMDDAVDYGLRWLAAHQSPNGSWSASGFGTYCNGKPVTDKSRMPDGAGKSQYDVGVTGLALCAFLGAGYTHRGKHDFARTVGLGLRYLKNVQDPEGCFGPRTNQQFIYGHAAAALAMVEVYGMTGSPIFKGSSQRALEFIALSRNPYMAWRYGVRPGDNDTSVSSWMIMPMKSAQIINADAVARGKPKPLVLDEAAFDGMRKWLDKMTDPETGRIGYQTRGSKTARPAEMMDRFPAEKSEAMTAAGLLARTFLGEDARKSPVMQKGFALLRSLPPVWNADDGSIDMMYWYKGALAAFQVGGETWNIWHEALAKQIVPTQRLDTDFCQYKGSWDPAGVWGPDGGRVASTALMTMTLEVFYRYDRVFGTAGK